MDKDKNKLQTSRAKRALLGGISGFLQTATNCWVEDRVFGSKAVRQAALADFEVAAERPDRVPLLEMLSIATGLEPATLLDLVQKTAEKKRLEFETARAKRTDTATVRPAPAVAVEGSLRWWCERAGLNPTQLGRLAGISNVTIIKIEQGVSKNPQPETVTRICNVLQLQPDEIREFVGLQSDFSFVQKIAA